MQKSNIYKNNSLLKQARKLRKEMTPQEKHLWYDFLRIYPVKIYKQRIIGNYIADFYCASANLVIELDGSQHYSADGIEHDENRDFYMNSLGIKTLRFSNYAVDNNFSYVCNRIEHEITKRKNYKPL